MRSFARALMVLLLLGALPLRGYAAITGGLCQGHHGDPAAAHAQAHDHSADHAHDSLPGSPDPSDSACSLCASCCVGALLAPDVLRVLVLSRVGASAIPFYGFAVSGRVPDTLDRPPLPL